VRVIRPGEPERGEAALDARALLDPPPVGPLGLALHPDFARNHFVYLSFLAQDGPERTLLRIVRLREVGDALGEPAALFEAPVAVTPRASRIANDGRNPVAADGPSDEGPRLAFGPDGLLYALLPPGIEFDNEPAASRPTASMLRIEDDGRVPDIGPLSGITTPPLGYAWHPGSDALWLISRPRPEKRWSTPSRPGPLRVGSTGRPVLRMTEGRGASGALVIPETQAGTLEWSSAFAEGLDYEASGTIRLAMPILAESLLAGMSGRISDVVAAGGGTLYLATDGAGQQGGDASTGSDVVVRLRARQR
jgi:glucose/arabinose dehydrogenase